MSQPEDENSSEAYRAYMDANNDADPASVELGILNYQSRGSNVDEKVTPTFFATQSSHHSKGPDIDPVMPRKKSLLKD